MLWDTQKYLCSGLLEHSQFSENEKKDREGVGRGTGRETFALQFVKGKKMKRKKEKPRKNRKRMRGRSEEMESLETERNMPRNV